jgi:hypothetical protein
MLKWGKAMLTFAASGREEATELSVTGESARL